LAEIQSTTRNSFFFWTQLGISDRAGICEECAQWKGDRHLFRIAWSVLLGFVTETQSTIAYNTIVFAANIPDLILYELRKFLLQIVYCIVV